MRTTGCKTAVLAAVASLAFVQNSQASWWRKHIVKPVDNHVIKPAENHVAKPIENHVFKPIENQIVKSTENHLVNPAVRHMSDPHKLWHDVHRVYYATSKATHETFHGLRIVDHYTLNPAKHSITKYAVAPAWKGVSWPTSWLGHQTIGLADKYLAMRGSLLPGGKYLDDGLGWMGKKIGVKANVFKMIDPVHDVRRVAGQVAGDAPALFHTAVGGAWDSMSFDPTRSVGAAEDIAMSSIAVIGNASMSIARPIVHEYAHGLMYQNPNAVLICADGVRQANDNRVVYYTNGVDTPENAAEDAATALSTHLQTPVNLIWNEGGGGTGKKALSIAESTYDRISNAIAVGPLRMLNGDSTTRRITGAIVEGARTNKELVFIAHSQGTLEVAGALQAAASLGLGDYIRGHVTLILTGTPLVKAEIQPKPKAIYCLHNSHDAVADLAGCNLTNPTSSGRGHSFVQDYLPSINQKWL